MKDLTLVFPQWQGSIDNMDLYAGAFALSDGIKGLPTPFTIPVPPLKELGTSGGIAGKEDLVSQLIFACDHISHENPDRILLLGGDCSTETAPASWFAKKHGEKFALVWFDAHPDLNTPASSQTGKMQGMALSALLGNCGEDISDNLFAPIAPRQVFCVGPRVFDPPELEFIVTNKIPFLGPGELEREPAWLAKKIAEAGFSKVYIHLDVDAVNPIGFSHRKPSPPAGLQFGNVLAVIRELNHRLDICGLGITEFHAGNDRGVEQAGKIIRAALPGFIKDRATVLQEK